MKENGLVHYLNMRSSTMYTAVLWVKCVIVEMI